MTSILLLGFLLGMQHALEADHLAAVSSISVGENSIRSIVTHGTIWGVGHTLTLMLFAGGAVLLGVNFSESMTGVLEFGVGIMLVYLGISVLTKIVKNKVHIHIHNHANDQAPHLHAHSHAFDSVSHDRNMHEHSHPKRIPIRTLFIGMTHGLAGSSALVILVASTTPSPLIGLCYVSLFGFGSILGMASLSVVIAVPFLKTAKQLNTKFSNSLRGLIGLGTVILGSQIVYHNGLVLLAS
ncbi:urease accessory protein [Shewanella sp. MEBiC00475]|uniref:urease accessory protein n=1 Tax=Shewanella sp. MEBiC00475 TaxID=2575361 RepID=UPI0010C08551|nr:urease accessory protein [Shewanella sp. MEBiC00475]